MRVAITGHKGYIGGTVWDELRERFGDNVELLGSDISDGQEFDIVQAGARKRICEFAPDVLFNFAGLSGEAACRKAEVEADDVHCSAAFDLRLALPEDTIFVQASTASLYAAPRHWGPYTISKHKAEEALYEAAGSAGERVLILRFGTVFGVPADRARMRWDLPFHRMVATAHVEKEVRAPFNERPMWRPVLDLSHLCDFCLHIVQEEMGGVPVVREPIGPAPLVTANVTLVSLANAVGKVSHARREPIKPEDNRSYAAPAIGLGPIDLAAEASHLLAYAEEVLR